MSDQRDPRAGDPVPPEFEHLMRPAGHAALPGAGETPRHDMVTNTALNDFSDLFRDEPASSADPDPTRILGRPAAARPAAGPANPHAGGMTAAPRTPLPPPGVPPVQPPSGRPPAPPRPGGVAPSPAQPGRQTPLKRVLLWILIGFLIYAIALAGFFALNVDKIAAMPVDQIGDTAGANYLLVGSDGRDDLTRKQRQELHTGYAEGNRTDTIMLLHVPLIGSPTLISIPRDSWVPIPGHGSGKINSAYSLGGPPLLIQTVENTTGVHIDNYVEVGMDGVADVVDSLGGVTLCPKDDYNDERSGLDVKKGCQEMDGKTALAYVRMRYADPRGDIGRAERQREYIAAVAKKSASPLTWLNPFKTFSVDRAAASSLTVDEGTGIVDDARMAIAFAMVSAGLGESTSVPIVEGSYWVDGQEAIKWDTPKALELFASIGG